MNGPPRQVAPVLPWGFYHNRMLDNRPCFEELFMVFKGLKFGMLLQLAVGPMCLMVFNTSATHGFFYGLCLVAAIALIDTFYIALSCIGVAAIISQPRVKSSVKLFGCLILVLMGTNMLFGAFGKALIPGISLFSFTGSQRLFVQGLLLTASNPLTIIFWGGIFTAQMIENCWSNKQLLLFAIGCILSTLFFLSLVAFLGSVVSSFLPQSVIRVLNAAVGIALVFFGLRLLLKKEKSSV